MNSGLFICSVVWVVGLLSLIAVGRSSLCRGDGPPIKVAVVPGWAKSDWPMLLFMMLWIFVGIPGFVLLSFFATTWIQTNLWANSADGLLLPENFMWTMVSGFFPAIAICFLVLKVFYIPFPLLEASTVLWAECNVRTGDLPKQTRAAERTRFMDQAWREVDLRAIISSQWTGMIQICLLVWVVFGLPYILLLDDYVRVDSTGVQVNTWFSPVERHYDWNSISNVKVSARICKSKGESDTLVPQFLIQARDGTSVNVWENCGGGAPSDATLIALCHRFKEHGVKLDVQKLTLEQETCGGPSIEKLFVAMRAAAGSV